MNDREFFEAWAAKPCNRCGGKRDYRCDGQLQVVCHKCAYPSVSAPLLTAEMLGEAEIAATAHWPPRSHLWLAAIADFLNARLAHGEGKA